MQVTIWVVRKNGEERLRPEVVLQASPGVGHRGPRAQATGEGHSRNCSRGELRVVRSDGRHFGV